MTDIDYQPDKLRQARLADAESRRQPLACDKQGTPQGKQMRFRTMRTTRRASRKRVARQRDPRYVKFY